MLAEKALDRLYVNLHKQSDQTPVTQPINIVSQEIKSAQLQIQ
jgi:hypothetical protein